MIELNKEIAVLLQHQERKIGQLVKFIWSLSANPELLKDQNLMYQLIDMDFNTVAEPSVSQLKDMKIQEREKPSAILSRSQ
ncbi:hypothetical protein [Sphingobacterium bambusae]|uniref:Uncharacterized protein n=1 Tax=Sphingobacterium bambusae TaxID=662858 RepID=A0ABW6B926_9SPHI|nr:hypothetical protein [Sphingobacterium bambusae]WPL49253.1 hypothetical protein SCB77_02105 [Sphingobacterium bambusae]